MILPVVIYGHPVLKKRAEEIDENYEGLGQFIDDMYETMYNADGIGLAAPQVGKSIRLFVIDASPLAEDEPSLKDFKKVFINPEIIEETGDRWVYNEGCLSLPTLREDVQRHKDVKIRYLDEKFNQYEEVFDGMKARIIQHEYDHLEGILFVDRISPLKKKLITGKLNSIKKGKVEIKYKFKLVK